MAALPALRQKAIEAIGEALSKEEIVRIVKAATGNDVFNIYADERDPRAVALSKTLKQLETEGTERWLLTYILIAIAQQQKLRMLIVKTWPATMVGLPLAGGLVDNTLKHLRMLLNIPLSINLRQELRPKHEPFDEIRRRITELYAYKSLHELLHILNVKLAAAESVPAGGTQDFNAILTQCDAIAAQGQLVVTLLDSLADDLAWISQLTGSASSLRTAIQASDNAACATARSTIEGLVRLRLMWLNGQVFKAANELPFEPLVYDYPLDIETQAEFGEFVYSVRDLKPTIIARALKQSLWQEVENEISLISDLMGVPGDDFSEFSNHWNTLKSRVLWLATLDPDDAWAKLVQQVSDEIDDGLSGEKLDDETKHNFETYRSMLRLRFLAIDNTFKEDCISLRLIDPPLTEILKELMP